MRIVLVGATGTIGRAVVEALRGRPEVGASSHRRAAERVDLADADSIRALYRRLG